MNKNDNVKLTSTLLNSQPISLTTLFSQHVDDLQIKISKQQSIIKTALASYQAGFFEFLHEMINPERHHEKSILSEKMKAACGNEITTLADMNELISIFEGIVTSNKKLDGGGRLGELLDESSLKFQHFKIELNRLLATKKNLAEGKSRIIYELLAIENELADLKKHHRINPKDTTVITLCTDHHEELIHAATARLIAIYSDLAADADKHKVKDLVNEDVQQLRNKIHQEFVSIENATQNVMTLTNEARLSKEMRLQKMKVLHQELQPYLDEKTETEIITKSHNSQIVDLSDDEKMKYFVYRALISRFAERIQLEEHQMFWNFRLNELFSVDDYINASLKVRKSEWYKDCYLTHGDPVCTARLTDSLNYLVELVLADKSPLTANQLGLFAEDSLQDHIRTHLKTDNDYQNMFMQRWQTRLEDLFADLKKELMLAETVMMKLHTQANYTGENDAERKIINLIQFVEGHLQDGKECKKFCTITDAAKPNANLSAKNKKPAESGWHTFCLFAPDKEQIVSETSTAKYKPPV